MQRRRQSRLMEVAGTRDPRSALNRTSLYFSHKMQNAKKKKKLNVFFFRKKMYNNYCLIYRVLLLKLQEAQDRQACRLQKSIENMMRCT